MQAIAFRDGTRPDPDVKRKALAKLTSPGSVLSIMASRSAISGFAVVMEDTQGGYSRTAHLSLLAVNPSIQARGVGRLAGQHHSGAHNGGFYLGLAQGCE